MDVKILVQFPYSMKGQMAVVCNCYYYYYYLQQVPPAALIHSLLLLDRIPVLASTHQLHPREFRGPAIAPETTAWL